MSKTMQDFRVAGRQIADILRDVNTILKERGVEEEESFFSDTCRWHPAEDTTWPDPDKHNLRWVACYPVKGSNEGIYIHIELIFQEFGRKKLPACGSHRMIGIGKCWTWATAVNMAMIAAEIFEGLDAHRRRDDIWGPITETPDVEVVGSRFALFKAPPTDETA